MKKEKILIFRSLILLFSLSIALGGASYLRAQTLTTPTPLTDSTDLPTPYYTSFATLTSYTLHILRQLQDSGYLNATLDSIRCSDSAHCCIYLNRGRRYYLYATPHDSIPWTNNSLAILAHEKAQQLRDSAKPEDQLHLQLTNFRQHSAQVQLRTTSSALPLAAIEHHGNFRIPMQRWQTLLALTTGQEIQSKELQRIDRTLNQIPYYHSTAPAALELLDTGSVRLHIFADRQKRNYAEGQIGFRPQREKVQFWGNAHLYILDIFQHGESVDLQWVGRGKSWQDFHLALTYPYLFDSPWGILAQVDAQLRDTTTYRWSLEGGISYRLSAFQDICLSIATTRTQWQNADENVGEDRLFTYLTYQYHRLHVQTKWQDGLTLHARLGIGKENRTPQNERVTSKYSLAFRYFRPIGRYLFWGIDGSVKGTLQAHNATWSQPFPDETFGGANHFRGLQEQQFPTQHYAYTSLHFGGFLTPAFRIAAITQLGELDFQAHTRLALSYGAELELLTNPGTLALGVAQFQPLRSQWTSTLGWLLHIRLRLHF